MLLDCRVASLLTMTMPHSLSPLLRAAAKHSSGLPFDEALHMLLDCRIASLFAMTMPHSLSTYVIASGSEAIQRPPFLMKPSRMRRIAASLRSSQ
jgi:hypothetical protein